MVKHTMPFLCGLKTVVERLQRPAEPPHVQGFEFPYEERLGLTSAARLQDYDHRIDELCRWREDRNRSETCTHAVPPPTRPPVAQTAGVMPANTVPGNDTMLAAITQAVTKGAVPLYPSAPVLSQQQLQRQQQRQQQLQVEAVARNIRARGLSKQCKSQLAPILGGVAPLPFVQLAGNLGHPKSGCHTHCMACKRSISDCPCPVVSPPETLLKALQRKSSIAS